MGRGYLHGIPGGNQNFFTYIELVDRHAGGVMGYTQWATIPTSGTVSQIQTAYQTAIGSANYTVCETFADYASMVAAHPMAADNMYGEILVVNVAGDGSN
jgi:hypothetical protein